MRPVGLSHPPPPRALCAQPCRAQEAAERGDTKSPVAKLLKSSAAMAIMTEAFTLTFLAEWGDRSQIATIALAAAKDPVGGTLSRSAAHCPWRFTACPPASPPPAVTLGGILGHALCTGLAVVGGRLLASKLSEKSVAIFGGVLFFVFALHSLLVGPDV